MDSLLAFSTLALAVFTAVMAWATCRLATESREASLRQIRIQTWLDFKKIFDSREILNARVTLAQSIRFNPSSPNAHKEVSESVMNFFEDLAIVYFSGYIEKKLVEDTFGFYVCRWWEAAKTYVDYERKLHNEDKTLFEGFEKLAVAMRLPDEVINADEMKLFLQGEKDLV
ncbi:MAG TPA: DUF4760 domain-containing protein [Candidatus Limnocylindrales bacterium]|nr:DUF4760 domain-containing protein [Candidatus Limnocylindrales bacterium]